MSALAGVVLAAGAGRRLQPLTRVLPKALCPVGNVPLVDLAIARLASVLGLDTWSPGRRSIAVNVHHGRARMEGHLADRVHRSVEEPVALGTAGAIGALRGWVAGRDVLLMNADAWLGASDAVDTVGFVGSWDRARVRLLCVRDPARGDFGDLRYAGVCLLPAAVAASFDPIESGLYERCWRYEHAAGRLDLVVHPGPFIDTGTLADYLAANRAAVALAGGSIVDPTATVVAGAQVVDSVVGAGAVVAGDLIDAVVWPGAEVWPREHLVAGVRAGQVTVLLR